MVLIVSPQQYAQLQEFYHSYIRSCISLLKDECISVVSARSRHVVKQPMTISLMLISYAH